MKTFLLLAVLLLPNLARATASDSIVWQPYSHAAFAQARAEHKLVLLELEAVWCHWCHVMDEKTWSNAQVAAAVRAGYVPVRVDQDARPDLASRYQDFGWPAIIILDADGRDLVKRAGYQSVAGMLALLKAVSDDPSPETAPPAETQAWADSPLLSGAVTQALKKRFVDSHDFKLGGLLGDQKIIDRDATEYALLLAAQGDRQAAAMARNDLAGARQLADPVWGGIYQYSTHGDWAHPHYEKLGQIQADYLRMFALGYAAFRDPADLATMRQLHAYLRGFLRSPDGAFYTSQDADVKPGEKATDYFKLPDQARRRVGIPRVDRHIYARENGLIATALVAAYLATDDRDMLDDARQAVGFIMKHRGIPGGGYSHDEQDVAGPYLADNLAMLRAFLALHGATGERVWLRQAMDTARFIEGHFTRDDAPGYLGATLDGPLAPVRSIDENLALARVANLLFRYSGDAAFKSMAESAMRYLASPQVALSRISDPGILLVSHELANDPVHITVVGHRDDPLAQALFRAAAGWPSNYKRVEWWDVREGPMPNPDVAYPQLPRSAAFLCTDGRCSLPLFSVQALLAGIRDAQE